MRHTLSNEEKLRLLTCKLFELQENDRKQVAQTLHDGVGNNLAVIKFALKQRLMLMKNGPRNDFCSLESVISYVEDTITEVRKISNHVLPYVLEELTLPEGIRRFCRKLTELHRNIQIIHRIEIGDNIPKHLEITLFRVMQEAVANAIRHSEADRILLSVTSAGDCIKLCVTDNGCGFDANSILTNPEALNGFGLKGMKNRAEICNGTLEISSILGEGTQVILYLPFDAVKEDNKMFDGKASTEKEKELEKVLKQILKDNPEKTSSKFFDQVLKFGH